MKKVLIITYHWPPMGGGGVQRWLKMCKYLRDFGWEPVIFTVTDAEISLPDESLLQEIPDGIETIRVPIWEPFGVYKKLTGKKKDEKVQPGLLNEGEGKQWINDLALWVRGNVFIPDAKRFWIKPARKALDRYLREQKVDALVSTGPPHTTHMIALSARVKHKIPWLADFRDPWTFVDYYDKLKLSKYADRRHHALEREVINQADKTVTVTWSWAEEFNQRHFKKQVEVITNGYDPADFEEGEAVTLDQSFTLTHIGSMNADRNPKILWPVLRELCNEIPGFKQKLKIKLIGPVDSSILKAIEDFDLGGQLEHIKHLPHQEVIPHLQSSPVLLLPLNDTPNISGVVPGKLFEYMGAKRPILCIGKTDGDAARIINGANAGEVMGFNEQERLKKVLKEMYESFLRDELAVSSTDYRKYGRDKLAGQIAAALDSITAEAQ